MFLNKCAYKHIYINKLYREENYKIVFPHESKQNALIFSL